MKNPRFSALLLALLLVGPSVALTNSAKAEKKQIEAAQSVSQGIRQGAFEAVVREVAGDSNAADRAEFEKLNADSAKFAGDYVDVSKLTLKKNLETYLVRGIKAPFMKEKNSYCWVVLRDSKGVFRVISNLGLADNVKVTKNGQLVSTYFSNIDLEPVVIVILLDKEEARVRSK